jgi:2'-5' RNA ligase
MRLFCGIEIPAGVSVGMEALIGRLRPLAKLSWTSVEKLHVTTKFIGEWPEERLAEIERALAGVPRPGPVEIGIRGLGWFPNERNPRVLWAGIEAGDPLRNLARDTDQCIAALGVVSEERDFNPHLTLARRRDPVPIERLRKEVTAIGSHDFGSFCAESFFLYLSKNGRYSKLQEFALQ